MKDKISIIVPAYNIEQYLARTLDSILAQTHTNIEVIVVDDGSSDGTGELIDHYAARDHRIKGIHKENGGVTSARLRGVDEARGDWIGFVDGDDYVEPDMYRKLLENAVRSGAEISHCGYQMVFPSRTDYYYNTGAVIRQDRMTGLQMLLSGDLVEPGLWNKLYHRGLFDGLSEWMDPSIRINEDLLMNYYLFHKASDAVFEDICPYHYILRPGSAATSKISPHKLYDPLVVIRKIMDQAEPELQPVLLQRLTRLLIGGASMPLGDQSELIAPFRKEARRELRMRLGSILRNDCGIKLKIMALWSAVWPWSYAVVRCIYGRVSGIDKKYEIR